MTGDVPLRRPEYGSLYCHPDDRRKLRWADQRASPAFCVLQNEAESGICAGRLRFQQQPGFPVDNQVAPFDPSEAVRAQSLRLREPGLVLTVDESSETAKTS